MGTGPDEIQDINKLNLPPWTDNIKRGVVRFATIAPFALLIWRQSPFSNTATGIIIVLFTLSAIEFLYLIGNIREINNLENSLEELNNRTANLEQLALSQFIEEDERINDEKHSYERIKAKFDITGDNLFMTVSLRGKNTTNTPTEYIQEKIANDDRLVPENMEFKAKQNEKEIRHELVDNNNGGDYAMIFRIKFNQPISPREKFDIEYECKLPYTPKKEDYIYFPTNQYKKGVDKLIGNVIMDDDTYLGSRLYSVKPGESYDYGDLVDEQIKEEVSEDGVRILQFEEQNPSEIYMLEFERNIN